MYLNLEKINLSDYEETKILEIEVDKEDKNKSK